MVVRTECAHTLQPLTIEIDSELNCHVREAGADPIIFIPDMDLYALEEPNIIESF